MEAQRVLCTGGRGFVGRHLVRRLIGRGNEVWCLLGPGDEPDPSLAGDIHWIRGDVGDPSTLGGLSRPFSIVYHLAAVNTSQDPARFYQVNYEGTINVVKAVLANGGRPRRLLYTSSFGAMGPASGAAGLNEDSPCRPVTDYGRSKLMAELFLRSLNGVLPVTIVRLPLVYGPGSRGGLLAYFRLINKGLFPCLAKGEATMGFVDDMVTGMIMAAETPGAAGRTFLLGDDRATSLEEARSCIEKAVGHKAVILRIPRWAALKSVALAETAVRACGGRPSSLRQDVEGFLQYPSWRADTTRARDILGFRARVCFAEGARITAEWYKRNGLL